MAIQSRLSVVPSAGPEDAPAGHLRDLRSRLRVLYANASLSCPGAIVRAADHLEALHAPLVGVMEQLGGPRTGEKWRKALSAVDRVPTMLDLAYLSTLPQAEPRAAVRGYAQRLLRDVGELARPIGTLVERLADVARLSVGAIADLAEAQADGRIDDEERARLLRELDSIVSGAGAARALLLNGGPR